MVHFKHTSHSRQRAQQRAVSDSLTQMVLRYGSTTAAHGKGAVYYYISRQSIAHMVRDGASRKLLDEASKKMGCRWVVSSDDQTLITIKYMDKRKRRIH